MAEFGCGYGTFTIPIAKTISGTLYTFDLDQAKIARTADRAAGLRVACENRDVMESGFGVQADAVLLFNILHCEKPTNLLRHAAAALLDGGEVLVIHWRYGDTPRGPRLEIRPKPERIVEWAKIAGLDLVEKVIDLPPWHYGLALRKIT